MVHDLEIKLKTFSFFSYLPPTHIIYAKIYATDRSHRNDFYIWFSRTLVTIKRASATLIYIDQWLLPPVSGWRYGNCQQRKYGNMISKSLVKENHHQLWPLDRWLTDISSNGYLTNGQLNERIYLTEWTFDKKVNDRADNWQICCSFKYIYKIYMQETSLK